MPLAALAARGAVASGLMRAAPRRGGAAAAPLAAPASRPLSALRGRRSAACRPGRRSRGGAAAVAVRAALAGASPGGHHHDHQQRGRLDSYLKLARIHNLVPSIILVLVGAWAGTGHRLAALRSASVWVMGLISGGMAVASVVVNDYFDLRIDQTNAPDKPLPSGAIAPDAALLLSSLLYCACLCAACVMEPSGLRVIVAFSAAATLLYTPLFKRLTAVKNATVAAVIALAPLAGALAAGAGHAGMLRLMPATLFSAGGVLFREVLMDINDAQGDKEAGVLTLPVLLGKRGALCCALACLALGCGSSLLLLLRPRPVEGLAAGQPLAAAVWAWLTGGGAAAGGAGAGAAAAPELPLGGAAGAAVVAGAAAHLLLLARRVWASGFDHDTVDSAVMEVLKPVGWGILLLAALG